jgi:hypothetical protein
MDQVARLSIVIVSFQSEDALPSCIEHARSTGAGQILVIDNASTDRSAQVARAQGVHVHDLPENVGFARACNIAAGLARGEILCFLNPDCHLDRSTALAAIRALAAPDTACAVPDYLIHGTRQKGRQPGYTRLKLLVDILESTLYLRWLSSAVRRIPGRHDHTWHWPLGTCLFVTASAFRHLGGFDEKYFVYMEDVDFGRRMSKAGGAVIALDHCLVHEGSRGSQISWKARKGLLDGARLAYAAHHHGSAFAAVLRLLSRC